MMDINTVKKDVEVLRETLSSLIQSKGELLDPEVLKASVLLDNALNEYNRLKLKGSCTRGEADKTFKYRHI